MHNKFSNRQKNLFLSVGCFGFPSRSRLLLPLCLGHFFCLQTDVGMNHRQENRKMTFTMPKYNGAIIPSSLIQSLHKYLPYEQ